MTPEPNSRETAAVTWGIARNLWADLPGTGPAADPKAPPGPAPAPFDARRGGGSSNGTAATSILLGEAGTGFGAGQVARLAAGNYCGIV